MKVEHRQQALALLQAAGLSTPQANTLNAAIEQEDENRSLDEPVNFTITMMLLVLEIQGEQYEALARSFFGFLELDDAATNSVIEVLRDSIKRAPTDPQSFFITLLLTASTLGLLDGAIPKMAAMRIQRTVRSYLARKKLHELKRRQAAIQKEQSALTLQSAMRGHLARQQLQRLKEEKATIVIQTRIQQQRAQQKLRDMKSRKTLRGDLLQLIEDRRGKFHSKLETEKKDMPNAMIDHIREIGVEILDEEQANIVEMFVESPLSLDDKEKELARDLTEQLEPRRIYLDILSLWAAATTAGSKALSELSDDIQEKFLKKKQDKDLHTREWNSLITYGMTLLDPLKAKRALGTVTSTSPFRLVSRASLGGAPEGRIHRRAVREANKDSRRLPAMVSVISRTLTGTRSGYIPGVLHWHIGGDAQNNIIFEDSTVLGFVTGHIDRENKPNVIAANRCEARRLDDAKDFLPVAVISGEICQVTP